MDQDECVSNAEEEDGVKDVYEITSDDDCFAPSMYLFVVLIVCWFL